MAAKSMLKRAAKKAKKSATPNKGKAAHAKAATDAKGKAEKKSKAAKKAHAVSKIAGMSKTTRDQLLGLVSEHDEKMKELDKAKARVSELRGQMATTVQEIFSTSKELEGDDDTKGEKRKKLVGLEKDRERYSIRLTDAEEKKTGLKETIKACRVSLFELIRDMAKGSLLFEQKGEKAGAEGAPKADPPKGAPPAPKPTASATSPAQPPSSGTATPGADAAPAPATNLADISVAALAQHAVPQSAIDALFKAGYQTIADLEGRKIGPNGAPGRLTLIKGISPQHEVKIEEALRAFKGEPVPAT